MIPLFAQGGTTPSVESRSEVAWVATCRDEEGHLSEGWHVW